MVDASGTRADPIDLTGDTPPRKRVRLSGPEREALSRRLDAVAERLQALYGNRHAAEAAPARRLPRKEKPLETGFRQAAAERRHTLTDFWPATADKVLIMGQMEPLTGRRRFYTRAQYAQEVGVATRAQLAGETSFYRDLGESGSYQTKDQFFQQNRDRYKALMARYGMSHAWPGGAAEIAAAIADSPDLLVRTYRDAGRTDPEFTGISAKFEIVTDLASQVARYGRDNVWLKTKDGNYKTPEVYSREEPETAEQACAKFCLPKALVRLDEGRYLDLDTYRTGSEGQGKDPRSLHVLVRTEAGDGYVAPDKLKTLSPEYAAAMRQLDLPPELCEQPHPPAPPVLAYTGGGEFLSGARLGAGLAELPDQHKFVQTRPHDGKVTGFMPLPTFQVRDLIMTEAQQALLGNEARKEAALEKPAPEQPLQDRGLDPRTPSGRGV